MRRDQLVAVIGADPVRREAIVRAFSAAGFEAAAAPLAADLKLAQTAEPLVLVFDGVQGDALSRELAVAKARWPVAQAWAVSAAARLLSGTGLLPPPVENVSCEGILQQALDDLAMTASGSYVLDPKIADAKREIEGLFDSVPDPVFVVSPALTIQRANRAFFDKLHKPPAEVIGRHCVELFHGVLEPWGQCLLAKALAAPGPIRWTLPGVALGEPFDCTTFKVRMADQTLGVAHHLRSIESVPVPSEHMSAPERLAALGQAAAGLVHELNNPLAAVLGLAELLEDSGTCPEEVKTYLRQIQHEVWRCRRIVGNLLSLAREEEPDRRPTNLPELLERVIAVRSLRPEAEGIAVERSLPKDLPPLLLDPDQVEQILVNLMSNAQEAIGRGTGHISVRVAVEAGQLVIIVADDGPGIEPDKLPRLFDPFFTTKGKGTGLGLTVSRRLARRHGGDLDCRNGPAGGAEFALRLPFVPVSAEQVKPRGAPGAGPLGRLLIIDDEPVIRGSLAKMLGADGHTVTVCATAEDARRAVESGEFDAIIADLRQLDVGGVAFLRSMRARRPGLAARLVLTTGGVGARDTKKYGPGALLLKPFTRSQVRRAVAAALRGGGAG